MARRDRRRPAAAGRVAASAHELARHARRVEEARIVGVDERRRSRADCRDARQSAARSGGPPRPFPPAGLEQPQAHDVLEEADRAVDAALVGEVRGRGSPVERAARRARRRPATRCRTRCTPSPAASGVPATALAVSCVAGRDHRDRRRRPSRGLAAPAAARRAGCPAGTRSGIRPAAGPARSNSSSSQCRVRTSSICVVVAFVCSPTARAGQEVMAEIGDQQQARGAGRRGRRATCAASWIERVERQELDAGAREDLARAARARAPRPSRPSVRGSR